MKKSDPLAVVCGCLPLFAVVCRTSEAPEVCPCCKCKLVPGVQIYTCEACGDDCCGECSTDWDGDEEDDETLAGMSLEVVCPFCISNGFNIPEHLLKAKASETTANAAEQPQPLQTTANGSLGGAHE